MGDQRNGEAASRRGGGGYHGQVATVSIYDDVVLLCVSMCVCLCLCVLCASGFVAVCFWFEFKFKFVTFDIVLVPTRKFTCEATYEFLK